MGKNNFQNFNDEDEVDLEKNASYYLDRFYKGSTKINRKFENTIIKSLDYAFGYLLISYVPVGLFKIYFLLNTPEFDFLFYFKIVLNVILVVVNWNLIIRYFKCKKKNTTFNMNYYVTLAFFLISLFIDSAVLFNI